MATVDILGSLAKNLTITNYDDWLVFAQRLNEAVSSGRIRQIPATGKHPLSPEQWFLDPATGEIYLYVAPDPPLLPVWEKLKTKE